MKNKINENVSLVRMSRTRYLYGILGNQKGSLLLVLIITMVVLSTLGGAMVYFFSSSTFENVVGNFSQRAYYVAESGMRFAVSTYRNSPDHATGQSRFNALNYASYGPIFLPNNNGKAALTIADTVGNTALYTNPNGDQTINLGGDLVVTGASASQFPLKNGYFSIVGVPGKFLHYKEKIANLDGTYTLKLIAGGNTGVLPHSVAGGTQIAAPKNQVSIKSTGTFPLAGSFGVNRSTEYGWVLSGIVSDEPTPVEPNFDPTKWSIDKPNPITPEYVAAGGEMAGGPGWGSWGTFRWNSSEAAIQVVTTASSGGQKRFLLAYNQNYFPDVWISQGQYLSYDTQVKIKTYNTDNANHLYNFMAGLSFRLNNENTANFGSFGASFKRGNESPFNLPLPDKTYVVLWRDGNGQDREMLAYKELTSASGVISDTVAPATIFNDNLTTLANWDPSTPWVHNSTGLYASSGTCLPSTSNNLTLTSNVNVSTDSYLTFRHKGVAADKNYSNYVVLISTDGGVIWSQLITVNQASNWTTTNVPLSITTPATVKVRFQYVNISPTQTTTNAWSIDDVSIVTTGSVAHLIDWSTILVRIKELAAPSTLTDSTGQPTIFAGQRVNEIEIFYGSIEPHGTANGTPLDDNRLANPRCVSSPCAGNWPPRELSTLQNTADKFTLVSGWSAWNNGAATIFPYTNTKTNPVCKFELAGSGNEASAIIRTNCRLTNSYTVNSEVGLSSFGTEIAGNVYFDDFGINVWGEGGIPYIDVIQQ